MKTGREVWIIENYVTTNKVNNMPHRVVSWGEDFCVLCLTGCIVITSIQFYKTKNVFPTKKAAQAECDERNRKEG